MLHFFKKRGRGQAGQGAATTRLGSHGSKKNKKRRVCGILFLLPNIARERGQGRARGSPRRPGPHGSKKKGKGE